jgi:imidazolonepropionase-like amidohydrolase
VWIRGFALPDGEPVDLFADGDRWTEIRALAAAGLRPHDALAAGSWSARSYLGLGGLTSGAPADAVVYDADPRLDLGQLTAPRAVILRGRLVHRS